METQAQDILQKLDLEQLVSAKGYYPIPEAQLIFYYPEWESYVITTIAEEKDYTAAHYDLLPEMAPYQLINGKLIYMAAPEDIHQAVLGNLHYEIKHYLKQNKVGKVRIAPEDVVLDEANVVQPDLFFVAIKRSSIINRKVFGAPDFVVEILSSNEAYDRGEKLQNYAQHGVVEYWIVHPTDEYIEVYHHQEKHLKLVQTATKEDTIASIAIEGFTLRLEDVFEEDI